MGKPRYHVTIALKGGAVVQMYASELTIKHQGNTVTAVNWEQTPWCIHRSHVIYIDPAEVASVTSRRLRWWETR